MATVGECIVGCVFEIFIYIYKYIIFNFCEITYRYINIFVYTIKNQKHIQYSHHNPKKGPQKAIRMWNVDAFLSCRYICIYILTSPISFYLVWPCVVALPKPGYRQPKRTRFTPLAGGGAADKCKPGAPLWEFIGALERLVPPILGANRLWR